MKSSHILILSLVVSTLFISCGDSPTTSAPEVQKQVELKDYFLSRHHINLTDIHQVFVLTERGCMTCNKLFSELAAEYLDNKSAIFLIVADGNRMDLSPFQTDAPNIIWELPSKAVNYPMLSDTKIFFLKEDGAVDTVISINAREIQDQLPLIRQRSQIISQSNEFW